MAKVCFKMANIENEQEARKERTLAIEERKLVIREQTAKVRKEQEARSKIKFFIINTNAINAINVFSPTSHLFNSHKGNFNTPKKTKKIHFSFISFLITLQFSFIFQISLITLKKFSSSLQIIV